ncbi:MAG TPA: FMN-binding glutamate synthase family protein [Spirochaetes bacterium]|nr:FMN-binding glutamate synthase family protein [Spirochaetota bacterium]
MTYIILSSVGLFLVLWILHDIIQKKHSVIRNFPIIGHLRFWLEAIGPEFRQYIVTNNNEERPFSRDQRRWIYASSKGENNYFGFGTDMDLEMESNHLIIKHSAFPFTDKENGHNDHLYSIPCAKVIGKARNRAKAFRPNSIINVSAMSFGSLSSNAIEAINKGVKEAKCLHNTGEGGVSPYHKHGGELIMQIGTSYFGCRDGDGRFNMENLKEAISTAPVRALEVKLSQGAKPAKGGILPASKITKEIAEIRGVPMGQDCISPPTHREFQDVDGLLDFVERLASETGLPVGIKSAVGEISFWEDLASKMESGTRGVDFITIDGGEGGSGAAPLAFSDHVSLPFKLGMSQIYPIFVKKNLADKIVFIGSGRLGFPDNSLIAFALGCDMVNVAREAMISLGCIQAQRCHTGICPSGVATQNRWLKRGLDPDLKAGRMAKYIITLRKEILQLAHACGVCHPALISDKQLVYLDGNFGNSTIKKKFGYLEDWGYPSSEDQKIIKDIMNGSSH